MKNREVREGGRIAEAILGNRCFDVVLTFMRGTRGSYSDFGGKERCKVGKCTVGM